MSSTIHLRVASRYLSSLGIKVAGFIPNKFFTAKKAELKAILGAPLKDPRTLPWDLADTVLPFFLKFEDDLGSYGLLPAARTSVHDRVDQVKETLRKLRDEHESFGTQILSVSHRAQTPEESVAWRLSLAVQEVFQETFKTLGDGLKVVLKTDVRLINSAAKRIVAKATPKELESLQESIRLEEDFDASAHREMYEFLKKVGLEKIAKSLITKEKIKWDPMKWIDFLREVLETVYSPEAVERGDGFKDFQFGRMKFVIVDPNISTLENSGYIKRISQAEEIIRKKGFSSFWYGVVFILSKESEKITGDRLQAYKDLGYESLEASAGTYHSAEDVIKITAPPSSYLVNVLVHELGHRYWYKGMNSRSRAKFNNLVQTNPSKRVRDYPSGKDNEEGQEKPVSPVSDYGWSSIEEAFAEAFESYVLGEDMNRDQIESFKSVLGSASFDLWKA